MNLKGTIMIKEYVLKINHTNIKNQILFFQYLILCIQYIPFLNWKLLSVQILVHIFVNFHKKLLFNVIFVLGACFSS